LSQNGNGPPVYTVSRLTGEIRDLLEERFEFIWVEGEVSNFRTPASGHYYLDLKDEAARIRAVMFRTQARYLRFLPENGMKVLARGRISVYAPRGEYQVILDYLEPLGVGALALAFEQLKRKLAAQGVFDEVAKRPLPYLPRRVWVITSPTGAAIRDFLKVIQRRFANIWVTVVPVRVQGEGAAEEMVEALDLINRHFDGDVIVLTRGGGSLEDLWAFNQEELALAIRRSRIPVVSAVGHEIDVTISDLAADFRAPTPSAAAELLVQEKAALVAALREKAERLQTAVTQRLADFARDLRHLRKGIRDPRKRLSDSWLRLDEMRARLERRMEGVLREADRRLAMERRALLVQSPVRSIILMTERLVHAQGMLTGAGRRIVMDRTMALKRLEEMLKGLSPLAVLKRGYSVTRKLPEGRVLTTAAGVEAGSRVHVLLAQGALECRVEGVNEDESPGP